MRKTASFIKKFLKDENGFSMIELMVVIAIIAIIGAVTVPNYLKMINKSKVTSTKNQLEQIRLVLNVKDTLPSSEEGLSSLSDDFQNNKVPKDAWGNDFIYNAPGKDERRYEVISLGADNREGGDGFDADIEIWE
ncbi:MAG: type II secretion system protein GspG [Spirochaetes bacterium]|nr:type II secretion system protein GspG [Spirochaetota bacterium]